MARLSLVSLVLIAGGCLPVAPQARRGVLPAEFADKVQPFRLDGGNGQAVLLIHGWASSPAHLRPLAEELNRAGFTVEGLLLRGHGTTLEEMEKATWRDWLQQVRDAYARLRKDFAQVHVVGFSMGGNLALLLAEEADVARLVTLAGALHPKDERARYSRFFSPFLPRFVAVEDWEQRPGMLKEYSASYRGYAAYTLDDLVKLGDLAEEGLAKVRCPLLVVQSKADDWVAPESPTLIFEKVSTPADRKQLLWLEKSGHVLTLDVERDQVVQAVREFLLR